MNKLIKWFHRKLRALDDEYYEEKFNSKIKEMENEADFVDEEDLDDPIHQPKRSNFSQPGNQSPLPHDYQDDTISFTEQYEIETGYPSYNFVMIPDKVADPESLLTEMVNEILTYQSDPDALGEIVSEYYFKFTDQITKCIIMGDIQMKIATLQELEAMGMDDYPHDEYED